MPAPMPAPWNTDAIAIHTQRLLNSFLRCTDRSLLPPESAPSVSTVEFLQSQAQQLFEAPFVVVSHGIQADPIFNYGNRKALELWELSWDELTQMPSRKTAEVEFQGARSQMLAEALHKGYIDYYEGIRISSTGRRFRILDGIIWNVVDETVVNEASDALELSEAYCWGQAAMFSRYEFL
ncbi:MAG: MEKHLA domain-containing protein [Synechococcales cyanobacterium RU_4_20]|nr:MEKHLA domain-containing protein [Synechococcales cyanobacterium RU_4_20]NJR71230.1 MEKHLA domain-containing protein [Synechococcales cyanobacterium CRU_2_2]